MTIFGAVLALVSLLAWSVFLALRCKIPAAFTPLVVLCAASLWFALFGLLGWLEPGGWLWYIGSAAALCFALFPKKGRANIKETLLRPGFLFFVVVGVLLITYFAIRQPVLSEWDEASLWGPIVKLMKVDHQLYTTAEIGWPWPATQTPTLPALSYFFQFFGPFSEWKIYAAYDLLLVAVAAALVGDLSFKQYKLAVPLAFIALLTPWFFTTYTKAIYVNVSWISSYGDIPAGMVFGGALLAYLGLRKAKAPLWPVVVVLAALSLIKDNTFLFALVAAGLVSCDLLFFAERPAIKPPSFLQRMRRYFDKGEKPWRPEQPGQYTLAMRLSRTVCFFVGAVLPYYIWSKHIAMVVAQRTEPYQMGETSLPLSQVVVIGVKMLLGIEPRSEQFTLALENMWDAFVHAKVCMLGSGLVVTFLILAVFLAAVLLAKQRRLRGRAILAALLSLGGFVGYSVELVFSYGIVFKLDQAQRMDSYNRYVCAYYIGWLLLSVGFLALAARDGRPYGFASGMALALSAGMVFLTGHYLLPQYTAIGYPNALYNEARGQQALADSVNEAIGPDGGRVFFISQGDNGERWFRYSYRLLPNILDYSGVPTAMGGPGAGGGTFGLPGAGDGVVNYLPYTPALLCQTIEDSGCEYVFIETLDDRFVETYGTLFDDGLAGAIAGETVLYQVEGSGNALHFSPVKMEVPSP